jgi:hypothetical protein
MGGKDLTITDGYLKDFANSKLASFITAMTTDASITKLNEFAAGLPSGATPGGDPSGGYNQLLTGNASSTLSSGVTLQTNFKTLATTLQTQLQNLTATARTMQYDLQQVDSVLSTGEDHAHLTADEMNADLQNLNFGAGTTGSGSGSGPSGSGTSTK